MALQRRLQGKQGPRCKEGFVLYIQEEVVFRSLYYLRKRGIFLRKYLCDLIVPLVALGLLGKSIYNARGNTASKTQALVGGHNQLLSQGSIFS